MIRRAYLPHVLAGVAVVCSIAMCGCGARGRFFKRARVDREPSSAREIETEGEAVTASFETACPPANQRARGGYLQQGPAFSTLDGITSPQAALAQLRHLTAENERLTVEAAGTRKTIAELQNELIRARQALLTSQEDCRAARNELITTRNRLEDWQRLMEKALDEFHAAEQEHLEELDRTIEAVRSVVDRQSEEKGDSPAVDAHLSDRGSVVNG
jgi:hypothetical protein